MNAKNSNIIQSFAAAVTDFTEAALIPDRLFLVFAVCAFFRGAATHLGKQSKLGEGKIQSQLVSVLKRLCKLNEEMTLDALNNVDPYANKYFVIENLVAEGRDAAEKWLNLEETGDNPLQALVLKYRDLTLADLGIEGVNPEYELQQKQLFQELDRSVGQLRRRNMIGLTFVLLVVLVGYYWLRAGSA